MARPLALVTFAFLWSVGGCYPAAELIDETEVSLSGTASILDDVAEPRIDWAKARDCRGKLKLLQAGLSAGDVNGLEETPFALISDQPLTGLARLPPSFKGVPATADSIVKDCVIRLGEMQKHKAEHRVIGRERVRSSYQSGSHREKNPAYDAAQARLRLAEKASKPGKSSIMSVGDPLIDLVGTLIGGAITGVSQWGEGDQVEEAIDALMATPRSIEHPKYRSYHFERTKIRASREAVIPVTMTDRRLQQSWRISLKRREIRNLAILDGLDRQDRNYAEHREGSMTDQEFRQWQDEPPELPLEDMIATLQTAPASSSVDRMVMLEVPDDQAGAPLRDTSSGADDFVDAAAVPRGSPDELAIRAIEAPPLSERSMVSPDVLGRASVVRLVAGDQRGRGVYVAPDFVLTASDLVEGFGLIDVEDELGSPVLGLVATVDRSLGLALVQVPRSGTPAILDIDRPDSGTERERQSRSQASSSGREVASFDDGPILRGRLLVGFRSDHGPDIRIKEIRAFLAEQDAFLIGQDE